MRDGTHAVPSAREFGTGLRAHIESVRELERQKACRELLWAIEAQEFTARLDDGAGRSATAIGASGEEDRDRVRRASRV
jgi:hypothetical protein